MFLVIHALSVWGWTKPLTSTVSGAQLQRGENFTCKVHNQCDFQAILSFTNWANQQRLISCILHWTHCFSAIHFSQHTGKLLLHFACLFSAGLFLDFPFRLRNNYSIPVWSVVHVFIPGVLIERIAIVTNGIYAAVIQFLSKTYVCTFLRFSLAQTPEDSCTLVSSRDCKN